MDIPLAMLILLCLIFLVIGAVLMLLIQYYVYLKISNVPEESEEQKHINAKYELPLTITQTARAINATATANATAATAAAANTTTSAAAAAAIAATGAVDDVGSAPLASINFVMQFLFHELKNSNRVRKWFYRKLSLELDELITKTTTGKLFDKLTIKELELGNQFPEIKSLHVHNVELDDLEKRIENLDLLLVIKYTGNFSTSIDADMVLGKKGSLNLKVKQLSGLARLQFTRKPYTHWSLSFLGDPELDLAVELKYQGRQMQTNITSLISSQIRKAVRRKHTLPNYKLRYKPFFHKTPEDDSGDCDLQPNGYLTVKVSELSRLMCPSNQITDIYCTLTMASLEFVEARQKDHRNVVVSLNVEIHKAKNQQIGVVFKQTAEHCVEIEAVLQNTPAYMSNLRAGDILMAIEGKTVTSIQQVAKVVKGLHNTVFSLRIERVISGIIRNDAILEDLELYEDLNDVRLNTFKMSTSGNINTTSIPTTATPVLPTTTNTTAIEPTDSPAKHLLLRHGSTEKGTSSESSLNTTPTSSPKKTKLIAKAIKKTISRETNDSARSNDEETKNKFKSTIKNDDSKIKMTTTPLPSIIKTTPLYEGVNDVEHYYQHSTIDCPFNRLIHMDDLSNFKLSANTKYLNVCVYGKCQGDSVLLGFLNIQINQILAECCETSLTQCWKTFELNPPIPQDLKSHQLYNQSGFDANLCFGDVLFAFTWDGNPNLTATETTPSKVNGKFKIKSILQADKIDDSGYSDGISVTSSGTENSLATTTSSTSYNIHLHQTPSSSSMPPRAHNFIRTHFQRATQCDFCGKKIWLKDAVQCRECSMCCHKKCINKCQNSTVCGPVDCTNALQTHTILSTPEFMVTDTDAYEPAAAVTTTTITTSTKTIENDNNVTNAASAAGAASVGIGVDDEEQQQMQKKSTAAVSTSGGAAGTGGPSTGLEVHRSSITGLLAQGIKRVNSANNLAIPGIVSSLTGGGGSGGGSVSGGSMNATNTANAKSLPPSPQHSMSRKSITINPFELVTQRLETISSDVKSLTAEQISLLTEPIINISKSEDVMTLAKNASKDLYPELSGIERVEKINTLLSKLRLALDSETALHTTLTISNKNGGNTNTNINTNTNTNATATDTGSSPQKKSVAAASAIIGKSEDRVQALSVIMLYLCTGLQHAQGVASKNKVNT